MNNSDIERLTSLGFELKESSTKEGILAGLGHIDLTEEMVSALQEVEGVEEVLFYVSKVNDEYLSKIASIPGVKKIGLLASKGYSEECKKLLEKSVKVSEFK